MRKNYRVWIMTEKRSICKTYFTEFFARMAYGSVPADWTSRELTYKGVTLDYEVSRRHLQKYYRGC